jgi:glycerophosphoryl diester phosphodiesterase
MLKIGHRGACGYAPENTLSSFQKALDLGADMVEFDVHVCNSGEVVVIHDETVDRTTNGSGRVIDKNLDELKFLNIKTEEKIPTLEEALDFIDKKIKVNIELKGRGAAEPVLRIINKYVTEKGWAKDSFYISSFSRKEVMDFKKANNSFKCSYIVSKRIWKRLGFLHFSIRHKFYSINIPLILASKKLIDKIHRAGLKVFVWTINEKADIEKMKNLEVDGIFSNFPDRI